MKSANRTQKELADELDALRERVSELERHERDSSPQISHMHEAIFVLFDRKLEFVNDRFVELFGVSPEEACSFNFDPMSLIAPESRSFIREQYKEGCRGAFATKQFHFTGLSKNGLKMACETFFLFIPYKWGVAIHGTLRSISASRRINEALQQRHSDLRMAINAVPTGVLYADADHRIIPTNGTVLGVKKFNKQLDQ
jgi:PAS domain-containing protein